MVMESAPAWSSTIWLGIIVDQRISQAVTEALRGPNYKRGMETSSLEADDRRHAEIENDPRSQVRHGAQPPAVGPVRRHGAWLAVRPGRSPATASSPADATTTGLASIDGRPVALIAALVGLVAGVLAALAWKLRPAS